MNRRRFASSLSGLFGAALASRSGAALAQAPARPGTTPAAPAPAPAPAAARAAGRLAPTKVTRIRLFYPQNYDRNGPQAFPQSNMVILVDTDAGITGIG